MNHARKNKSRIRKPGNIQRSTSKTSIMDVPEHVFIEILRKCPPATLLRASLACKELYARCTSDRVWKTLFQDKWGKLLGQGTYRQWVRSVASKSSQWMNLTLQEGSEAGEEPARNISQSLIPTESLMRLRLQGDSDDVEEQPRKLSQSLMPTDSFMAWYTALENGQLEFRAQVRNRDYGNHAYLLSSYDAKVRYDRYTNTFSAKYPRLHGSGEGEVESPSSGASEVGIAWSRLRACPVDIGPWEIYDSDCLQLLKPGDHIEVQWRNKASLPFGWWYGTVGHTTQCHVAEKYPVCRCEWDTYVRIEFNQYSKSSTWQVADIDRRHHRETALEGRGFYGGIRKLCDTEDILSWRKHWTNLFWCTRHLDTYLDYEFQLGFLG